MTSRHPRCMPETGGLARFSNYPLQSHERGMLIARSLASDPQQWYLLYTPPRVTDSAPVIVAVHGGARDVVELSTWFVHVAEAYGAVLVAPVFGIERYRRFDRFAIGGDSAGSEAALDAMLAQVWLLTSLTPRPLCLFGHDIGADFALRYAAARPARVSRLALCHPRRLPRPDLAIPHPEGLGGLASAEAGAAFVSLPIRVWSADPPAEAQEDLRPREGPIAPGRQRPTAGAWSAGMHGLARANGWPIDIACHGIAGSDGTLSACAADGTLSHAAYFLLS
jgi:pimeloyl-ACP methyl ester carboxylesterase